MNARLFRPLLVLVVLALTGCSYLRDRTPAAGDVPRVALETYALSNGLNVILSRDTRLPIVAVNLWYHVGPANEEPGLTGFAHLFEHLMFQSSKHIPADAHLRLLEAAGASDLNGTTNFDRTNYYATIPANQLELALWLESDRMGYLLEAIDQPALSNQQDVVRNERREVYENRPYGMASERLVQMLYPQGHPYHGNIIGSHDDIQAARLEDVHQFFRRYYAPNNASLAIAGDFEPSEAKALIEKYFGTLKRGPEVPAVAVDTPPITAERRAVVQDRVELPRVYMAWLTPPLYAPGDADADVAADILGGGRSSRLYKTLVYDRQIAQSVSAYQVSLKLGSFFQVEATARQGHTAEELERAIDEELAALRSQPPTGREVERALNSIETAMVGGLEHVGGLADQLNAYNHYVGTPDYLQQDVQRYREVTPASVHAFARERLQQGARVVVHVVPGTPETPASAAGGEPGARPPVAAALPEPINDDEPWRTAMPGAGPARDVRLASPASVTLPNGLTLILDERRELPLVAARLVFRTGSGANPPDMPGLASFVAAMLDEGTTTRSALEIADEVAHLGASLETGSSMDAMMVSAQSLARNFPATLDLMADVVLRPSFPAEELERQRASRLNQLVQQSDTPASVAARVMALSLYGDRHPYGFTEIGTEASVQGMTRDDITGFWAQNLVPNNAALVVAGDISMSELQALAEQAFGAWQSGTPAQSVPGAPATTSAKVVIVDKPGTPQTQIRVATIGAARSSPDFRPTQVMNMTLGGLFASRINVNLREVHGYTYGVYSQFQFLRSAGPFQVAGGVRTDATGPALAEVFREIRGMTASPMTPAELQDAKTSLVSSLPGAFEGVLDAVGNFSNVFLYDLGLDYYATYAAEVNAVTAGQATAMAQKYLGPERLIVIAVGDRKTIEPQIRRLNLGRIEIRDPQGRVIG